MAVTSDVAKLAVAVHPKYRAMVLLAAYCSLRFGELAGLWRSRIDLLHRTVTVEEASSCPAGEWCSARPRRRPAAGPCQFLRSWYRW